jgi:ABC-type tungstate transport system permease subunit
MPPVLQIHALIHDAFVSGCRLMAANPKKVPGANFAGAPALSDFLLTPKAQDFPPKFGWDGTASQRLFFSINAARL